MTFSKTNTERPVPQVREALEEAPRPWSFEEGGDGMLPCIGDADGNILMQIHLDPYGSPRIEQKMAAMKMAVQAVNVALTARPSDAAVAWRPDDLRVQIACKIVGHIYTSPNAEVGPATQSTRERGLRIADEIIALLALPPDEPARVDTAAFQDTDDADATAVLAAVRHCANSWDGSARLLGNVRAVDIARACSTALVSLAPARVTPSIPQKLTHEMEIAGARSIGNTIHAENHIERARDCWRAMLAAFDGTEEPKPSGKQAATPSTVGGEALEAIQPSKE